MKRKHLVITAVLLTLGLGCGITANAQPKTMPDGKVFDAEFYAQTYPDVAAVIGTDENSLYRHYLDFGAAEGRLAAATQTEQPAVKASTIYAPGSVDLRKCALAGQESSIEQQLVERVPEEYGGILLAFQNNSIQYASHSGGAGSYTMSLIALEDTWELMLMNDLLDTGDGFSAVADINRQVLQGMCNAICSDGDTLYATLYNEWEGEETLTPGEWKDFGSFQLKIEIVGGLAYFYIR